MMIAAASRPMRSRWLRLIALLAILGFAYLAAQPTQAALSDGSAEYTFTDARIGPLGYIDGLVIRPNSPYYKYVRTDVAAAYRYDDSSGTWTALTDKLNQDARCQGIESIAIDPRATRPDDVYVACADSVWKSTDRGTTWANTNLNVAMSPNGEWRGSGERLIVDPTNANVLFFASRQNGLWRYDGSSWSQESLPAATSGKNHNFVLIDPATDTRYVGVQGAGVYRKLASGSQYEALSGQPDTATYVPSRATIGAGGKLFVTYSVGSWGSPSGGAVYSYIDGSGSAVSGGLPANTAFNAITVNPSNSNHLIVGTWKFNCCTSLYRTLDGGASWQLLDTAYGTKGAAWWSDYWFSTGFSGLAIDPQTPSRTWVTDGFSVWRSDVDTASSTATTWASHAQGIETFIAQRVLKVPAAQGGRLLVSASDIAGLGLSDLNSYPPDTTSSRWYYPAFGNVTDLDSSHGNPGFTVRTGGSGDNAAWLAYSQDGGGNWTEITNIPERTTCTGCSPKVYPRIGGRVVVSSTNTQNLLYIPACYDVYYSAGVCDTGANSAPSVYYTTNQGTSWTKSTGLPAPFNWANDWHTTQDSLTADKGTTTAAGQTFYLFGGHNNNGGRFYRSTNSGASFTMVSQNVLPQTQWNHSIRAVPGVAGEVWLGFAKKPGSSDTVGLGLWRSTDRGSTWTQVQPANVTEVDAFAFGKAAPGFSKPALYLYGVVGGQRGLFRSNNATTNGPAAATFVRLTTGAQGVAPPAVGSLDADLDVYGTVYVGTARGVVIGRQQGTQPAPTATATGVPTATPIATATPTTNPNLVSNPGFESGSASWSSWGNDAVVQTNAYSGSSALRVGYGSGGAGQVVSVQASSSYTLSAWGMNTAGCSFGAVGYTLFNASYQTISEVYMPSFGGAYGQQQATFTTTSATAFVQVNIWGGGSSCYLYVDDVALRRN